MTNSTRIIMWVLLIAAIGAGALWILGGKQEEFSTALEIDATPDSIFPYLTEPERLKSWSTGLSKVEQLVATKPDLMAPPKLTPRVVTDDNGKKVHFQDRVIRYEKNVKLSVQSSNPQAVITSIFQLEPRDGQTFVTYRVKSVNRGVGRFLAPLASDSTQSRIETDIRKLKSVIEGSVEASANRAAGSAQSPDGAAVGIGSSAVQTAETPVSGQPFSFAN